MGIYFEEVKNIPTEKLSIEIAERKGIGHPDTICDLVVEEISRNLSREYIKKFGEVLHFNIDKALLVAGRAVNKFGGGKILEPIKFIFGDRATFFKVNVEKVVISTAKKWFRENLRFLKDEYVNYQIEIKEGSEALKDIFKRKKKKSDILGANDTSACVGYYPNTILENSLIKIERYMNSKSFKKMFPESGEDVKIMGIRKNGSFKFIIANAFVDRFIKDENEYFKVKEEVKEKIFEFTKNELNLNAEIVLNALDEKGRGESGLYLTVSGTCAESADCGQVGRGNKVNGVFSLVRPTSSEAAAGKNPVSHIGKIYNYLSFEISKKIYNRYQDYLEEVYVWLISEIGKKISVPELASIQVIPKENKSLSDEKDKIISLVEDELSNIRKFTKKLIFGKIEGFI